ncbi:hypothetical protein SEA_FORZA_177 [Gordonia phage Forza]|uniref:Uncharacterized protein n=1 Tax=Gordonia phage Forza TaxID=2571247 RepID=A0A650EZL5_9CAUD|nr:hypothetical protein PP303_gp151 [Gordonia phage Forza]QEM41612.1 hypothetical protein SEA_BOOPY_176 [Gordonia phage Boopy]QGT55138.1 hypothetical protein SEA_FORZA_177 [Gordonia phage Forza]UXE04286.1 hypothetical protein SEA_BLUENGOLD_173 [Gordonia phage BlueNGold]WBF03927.1 hypothetical protein SEA_MAREELIH_174 [Gordonia phage Mareelih]
MEQGRVEDDVHNDFDAAGAVPSSSWRISPYPKIPINPVVHGLTPPAEGPLLRGEDGE